MTMMMTTSGARTSSPRRVVTALLLATAAFHCMCVVHVSARKIYPGPGGTPKPGSVDSGGGGGGDASADAGVVGSESVHLDDEHDASSHYDDMDWRHDYDGYGDFNVTKRLEEIFPLMDVDHDGHISKSELKRWHLEQGKNSSLRRARNEFEMSDNDKDGYVTLKEYLEDDFDAHVDAEAGDDLDHMEDYNKKWVRNTRITFNLSDTNHDGKLNADEFYVFLHPEESGVNAKLVKHLIDQDVRDHDKDRDGKLNFTEFFEGMYNELEEHHVAGVYDDESENGGAAAAGDGAEEDEELDPTSDAYEKKREAKARKMFDELDADKDGRVTADEVRSNPAALKKLHPTEEDHADDQSDHLVREADGNKDGKLTLGEMVSNSMAFYSTAMNDNDEYPYHDEFK